MGHNRRMVFTLCFYFHIFDVILYSINIGEITGFEIPRRISSVDAFRIEPIPSIKVGRGIAISDRYCPDCFLEDCGHGLGLLQLLRALLDHICIMGL